MLIIQRRGGVLLLTNNTNAISLFEWLNKKVPTYIYSEKLEPELLQWLLPKIIISYNYQYIISEKIIEFMRGNIINLHISYLPYNRGSSPNIWSFIDDTPKGVTIHKIAKGLDTGDTICQKEIHFDEQKETLSSTYRRLNEEIVELFKSRWEDIYRENYTAVPQAGKGSYHTKKDLENLLSGKNFSYDMTISEFKKLMAGEF